MYKVLYFPLANVVENVTLETMMLVKRGCFLNRCTLRFQVLEVYACQNCMQVACKFVGSP